ncbi:MAG: argininosuccinate lyase [Gammaproteobacteria bacterium]
MSDQSNTEKLWGGRFAEATDRFVEEFTASVGFDRRLYAHDIEGSIAHARMLARCGILTAEEAERIVTGLEDIRIDIERGEFAWLTELEDVHMNIESRLTERIGPVGKKLHTARSRNDQVATDVRLYMRAEIDALLDLLGRLCGALVDLAEREAGTIMPGFTHLQPAQPVTFGHHMLAWVEMLLRDRERLADCRRRVNRMPLGAAALAGTSFPIDRAYTASLLGFDAVCENSLDAVSDRDFAIEFAACASLIMMHLSRFSEELVLWASPQVGFIDLPDKFCTGSSIMPQKKNPDVPELIRGKTGRVFGHLMSLLTLMKGQALAYNKDNQEDKEPLFDLVATLHQSLTAYAAMMPQVQVQRERMLASARAGFTTATDLADYLVRKGVPFRDAHSIVGRAVRHAVDRGCDLSELALDELRAFSTAIDTDVFQVLTLEGSVGARNHIGGTAPAQVRAAVERARARIAAGPPVAPS